jgi:hypothetical protein
MADKLNDAAKTYSQMQNKNWGPSKEKAKQFSKGASESGDLIDPKVKKNITSRLKGAWKALTE